MFPGADGNAVPTLSSDSAHQVHSGVPAPRINFSQAPEPAPAPEQHTVRRVNIRIASEADWPRIEPAYRSVMAPGRYFEYPATERSELAKQRWMEPLPGRTVMALEGDVVVGSARMAPAGLGPASHLASWQAWVVAEHRSRGIGQFLTEYVLDWAQIRNYHGLIVTGVTSANVAASELLSHNGYVEVGSIPCGFDDPSLGYVDVRSFYREVVK